MLIGVVLVSLIELVICGRIQSYGSHYITISNSNPGNIADYNFTMIFDNPIPAASQIHITFPSNQYPSGLFPGKGYVYGEYPKLLTFTVDDRTVICNIGSYPAKKPLTINI
jgi:hypothetical protein